MAQQIIDDYKNRITLAAAGAEKYKKLIDLYSLMRLGTMVLLIVSIYLGAQWNNFTIIVVSFCLLAFAFTWLVSRQSTYSHEKRYYEDLLQVTQNEIRSITDHQNIYDNGLKFSDDKHFYTSDLDLFGEASLFQLVNRAATAGGNE
jgi:hypothetical protein